MLHLICLSRKQKEIWVEIYVKMKVVVLQEVSIFLSDSYQEQ